MPRKKENSIEGSAAIAGGLVADEATKNLHAATSRVLADTDQLKKVVDQYAQTGAEKLQGRAFEFLEVLKFNRAAAEMGRLDLEAFPTHFMSPHSAEDIVITKDGKIVEAVQAKSRMTVAQAIHDHAAEKYHGLGRLNPVEMYEKIKSKLEGLFTSMPSERLNRENYEDVHRHLMRTLNHDGVHSPGTTRAESEFAARHPEIVGLYYDGGAVLKELGSSSIISGSIAGGSAAIVKGLFEAASVIRGKKEFSEAISDTISCSTAAAVRGATVGGIGTTIKILAQKGEIQPLTNTAAPFAIANSLFDMGRATHNYLNGKISEEEFKEQAGFAAMKGVATYYCGMVGQILIPVPVVGGIIGSVAGYTTASMLLQAGVLGLGPNSIVRIARDRRMFVEKQCHDAIDEMARFKEMFLQIQNEYKNKYIKEIIPAIQDIEQSLGCWNVQKVMSDISRTNAAFSKQLQFRTFEEFDVFMGDRNIALKL